MCKLCRSIVYVEIVSLIQHLREIKNNNWYIRCTEQILTYFNIFACFCHSMQTQECWSFLYLHLQVLKCTVIVRTEKAKADRQHALYSMAPCLVIQSNGSGHSQAIHQQELGIISQMS